VALKPSKQLVLTAMVFAVAMTFIDQTIVAIALLILAMVCERTLRAAPYRRANRAL
jgi:hypothetical protein